MTAAATMTARPLRKPVQPRGAQLRLVPRATPDWRLIYRHWAYEHGQDKRGAWTRTAAHFQRMGYACSRPLVSKVVDHYRGTMPDYEILRRAITEPGEVTAPAEPVTVTVEPIVTVSSARERDITLVARRAYARDLAVLRRALLGLHVLFAALAVVVATRALLPALVLGVGSIGMLWLWSPARVAEG